MLTIKISTFSIKILNFGTHKLFDSKKTSQQTIIEWALILGLNKFIETACNEKEGHIQKVEKQNYLINKRNCKHSKM